jgi:hypothetical protein
MKYRREAAVPDGEIRRLPEKLTTGVVVKLNEDGLGFLEEEGSKSRFAFTFDKIVGYKGESALELGLYPGVRVRFSVHQEKVRCVESPRRATESTSSI